MSGGTKYDGGKLRFDLVPVDSLESVAKVLTFGCVKYGDRNWEAGILYGRLFAAIMRHLWAWWRGESKDPESGISHLAHAACGVFMLLHFESNERYELDNRPFTLYEEEHKEKSKWLKLKEWCKSTCDKVGVYLLQLRC